MYDKVLKVILTITMWCSFSIKIMAENEKTNDDSSEIVEIEDQENREVDEKKEDLENSEENVSQNTDENQSQLNSEESDDVIAKKQEITDDNSSFDTNSEDPMNYRDSTMFYMDENGIVSEDAYISTLSEGFLGVNSLVHQNKFSSTTKRIGIDVSEWQGTIDWNKVKNQGVEFAFIRVGYRGYYYSNLIEDKTAKQNLQNAKNAGIKIGAYFYSKAINTEEAKDEANFACSVVNGLKLDLPVFLDVEYDNPSLDRLYKANLSSGAQTDIVNAFIGQCKNYGFSAGVYASANVLKDRMYTDSISQNGFVWLAHWTHETNFSGNYNFWQYSGTDGQNVVDGIKGAVDTDVWYDDGTQFNTFQVGTTMYRCYNPNSGEHFYTGSLDERNHIVSLGWVNEGVGWIAPNSSSTPVYRLYNPNAGEHHYTTSSSERDSLIRLGWKNEGIGWYSDDLTRVPVYREYNPNAFANNHNYTKSLGEHNWLISLGWRNENIGWYAIG